MAVIIPCAGRSSRFPGTRPKFLLTLYNGDTMFERAAKPYVEAGEQVHFIVLKEHVEKYDAKMAIEIAYEGYDNVFIHVLDDVTSGPAETVYTVARRLTSQPIFIQDCDSYFDVKLNYDNQICVADLRKFKDVTNVAAKSYAVLNEQDMITNIVEKSVVSNHICVGGYGFKSAEKFCEAFDELKDSSGEIFISHIIKRMLEDTSFEAYQVSEFTDVGTYDEFVKYNQTRPTIFCDLDGTVFVNQSKLFSNHYGNIPEIIEPAVTWLLRKERHGSKIIFTTSRPEKYKKITERALQDCGFQDITVLYDIPHAPRLVINDNSKTNPYPTAIAMNVPRNDEKYWKNLL